MCIRSKSLHMHAFCMYVCVGSMQGQTALAVQFHSHLECTLTFACCCCCLAQLLVHSTRIVRERVRAQQVLQQQQKQHWRYTDIEHLTVFLNGPTSVLYCKICCNCCSNFTFNATLKYGLRVYTNMYIFGISFFLKMPVNAHIRPSFVVFAFCLMRKRVVCAMRACI